MSFISLNRWRLTTNDIPWNGDWDTAVKQEFGEDARVAEWSELEAVWDGLNNATAFGDFLDSIGFDSGSKHLYSNGSQFWSSSRAYFASRHEGSVPSGYLQHDSFGSNWMSLGSWSGNRQVLVILPEYPNPFVLDIHEFDGNELFYSDNFNSNSSRIMLFNQVIDAGVSLGDLIYYDAVGEDWVKSANATPQGIYTGNNVVMLSGIIELDFDITPNVNYWMNSSGELTDNKDEAFNGVFVGYALDERCLYVNIDVVGNNEVVEK